MFFKKMFIDKDVFIHALFHLKKKEQRLMTS